MPSPPLHLKLYVLAVGGIPKDVQEWIPGTNHGPEQPAASTNNKYFEWLESHTQFVYPALAVAVLGMMAYAILSAWKKEGLDVETKIRLKKAIVQELRLQMTGMAGDKLARAIGMSGLKTAKLLEEMQRDGILWSHMGDKRLLIWRLKGIGPDEQASRGRRSA